MPEVTLKAGRPYLAMHRERREDLEELAARLRSAGINVDIEITEGDTPSVGHPLTEYVPGRRGVAFNQAEAVAFHIAGAVTTALLSNVTDRRGPCRRLLHLQRDRRGALHDQAVPRRLPGVQAFDQDACAVRLLNDLGRLSIGEDGLGATEKRTARRW